MIPVPGHPQGTPFGARSRLWSCDRDSAGEGRHTGTDYPAPVGTLVVAARPGIAVWTDHGAAFGGHQLEVRCDDSTRDFYAHMSARLAGDGEQVTAGQPVGRVGAEGNVTGPHLHFERHALSSGPWTCDIIRDPQPSLDWEDDMPAYRDWDPEDRKALAADIARAVWGFVVRPKSKTKTEQTAQAALKKAANGGGNA